MVRVRVAAGNDTVLIAVWRGKGMRFIYSSLFTSNGSKNTEISRQTDRQKQTVFIVSL